jgi:hypothetical protein
MQNPNLCVGAQTTAVNTPNLLVYNCNSPPTGGSIQFLYNYYNNFAPPNNPNYGWNVYGGCGQSTLIGSTVGIYSITTEAGNDYFIYNSTTFQLQLSPSCVSQSGMPTANLCVQFINSVQAGGGLTAELCQPNNLYQQFGFISIPSIAPPTYASSYNSLVVGSTYNVVPMQNTNLCVGAQINGANTNLLVYNCNSPPSGGSFPFQYNSNNNFASYQNPNYGWNVYGGCTQATLIGATVGIYQIASEAANDYFFYNSTSFQLQVSPTCVTQSPGSPIPTPNLCLQFINSIQAGGTITVEICQPNNIFQQFGFQFITAAPLLPTPSYVSSYNSLVAGGVYYVVPSKS